MADVEKTASLKWKGDNKDYLNKLKQVKKQSDQTAKHLKEAFSISAKVLGGITAGFALITREAVKSNTSILALGSSLRAAGKSSDEFRDKLIAAAKEVENTSTYNRDQIIMAQAQVIRFGELTEEQTLKSTQLMADIAAGSGRTIQETGRLMAKVFADITKATSKLREMDIILKPMEQAKIDKLVESGNLIEANTVLIEIMQQKFVGSAKAMVDANPFLLITQHVQKFAAKMGELLLEDLKPFTTWLDKTLASAKDLSLIHI